MNESAEREERDAILIAFHRECERPTAEQIITWLERYPEYAEDIRTHAAVALDWAAREKVDAETELSQSLLDRGHSNALNAFFNARQRARGTVDSKSFHDLAAARDVDVVDMADEMDIARGVLADLFDGAMLRPIRSRLIDGVCRFLSITGQAFDAALDAALAHPRFGHAKATGAPIIRARPCDEIIRDSPMSPERKRYWLDEA